MPDNSKGDALARQWELLRQLPSRGTGRSASDLTKALAEEGFKVSKRTVERDLVELARLFPIECNDRDTPYGWRWMPDAQVDLPGLAVSEALTLRLLSQYLRPLLPKSILQSLEPRFRQAEAKLAALAPSNRATRWADKVRSVLPALALIPPKIDPSVMDAVEDALLADQQLEVQYQTPDAAEPRYLRLHPLALVQRGPVTYLVATVYQYTDTRLFAVHRIKSAAGLQEKATRPRGFLIDGYIASGAMDFGSGNAVKLVAQVTPALARILEETPLSADMKIETTSDTIRLTATILDSWQLEWWILSQGDAIKINKPAALRKRLALVLRQAADQY